MVVTFKSNDHEQITHYRGFVSLLQTYIRVIERREGFVSRILLVFEINDIVLFTCWLFLQYFLEKFNVNDSVDI